VRWQHIPLLLLVAFKCSSIQAQDSESYNIIDMILSGPSTMQAVKQGQAPTTCRLTLEGGSNKTELEVYSTSIARAELVCTGRVIRIAVHPVLAPFVRQFKGVSVAKVPSVRAVALEKAAAGEKQEKCVPKGFALLYLCNGARVAFVRPRIVNINSASETALANGATIGHSVAGPTRLCVIQYENSVVTFLEPFISRVQMGAVESTGFLYMQGGVVNDTRGVEGYGMMVFEGTRFTHNKGLMNGGGGAVTLVFGNVVFVGCVFIGNWARTMSEITGGDAAIDLLRSGLGGAVLVLQYNKLPVQAQTPATFVSCVFRDNVAYEGGAIAVLGLSTSITNCTFEGNRATQNGFDVFASRGASLNITDSNITVASPTVLWERVNMSECLRGEFFGTLDGTCRRCAASTYSLMTPVPPLCSACPANAQVGVTGCGRLTFSDVAIWHNELWCMII